MQKSLFASILLLTLGCTRHHKEQENHYQQQDYGNRVDFEEYEPGYAMQAPELAMEDGYAFSAAKSEMQSNIIGKKFSKGQQDNQDQDAKRMIHYNGSASLLVSRLPETLDTLESIAVEYGGGLIARGSSHIMLQVPRANFDVAYAKVLSIGEVLHKNVSTTDVTEAFTDTALRLEAMKTTRARLIELLAKTSDEAEKVRILQQIQRLSEDIDSKEALLRGLKNLADFSNITIHLELRQAGNMNNQASEISGFKWINKLSPFEGYALHDWKKLKLKAPEGMVVLEPKGHYHAESSDKANVFAGRIPNNPQGTSQFWQKAIIERVGGDYNTVEKLEAGDYIGIRLVADEGENYVWTMFVRADGNWLNVIQAYYPSKEHENRLSRSVLEVVKGGVE